MAFLKWLCSAMLVLGGAAHAELACRVLDPELAAEYRGPCHEGLAEGPGEARGSAHYRGHFHAGKKHGLGEKTWANGDRYQGAFADDKKHGQGRYEWGPRSARPGARYEGGFDHDLRHGAGRYWNEAAQLLETEWAFDQPIGPLSPQWRAYVRHQAAQAAALATPGATVCTKVKVGLAGEAMLRATVIDATLVRIDDPGPHPLDWAGAPLSPGQHVPTASGRWWPCQ